LPRVDLVLISHAHFDHLHRPTLRKIADGQTVLVPRGVGPLLRRMPFRQVKEMKNWQCHLHGEVEVVFTPSCHWGARYIHDTHRGFGGFLIRTPHASLYHCGDSAYFEGFARLGRQFEIDTALLPIGAYDAPSGRDVHMNPEEAVQAFEDLGARRMIPMHYATFPLGNEHIDEPLQRLEAAARARGIEGRVVAPREGAPLLIGSNGDRRR
jgi:L-ascorbate metabolism protein UlaG (beta-lactamase superfamily)